MRTKIFLTALIVIAAPVLVRAQANSCVDCHLKLDGELKTPAVNFAQDAHARFGLTCKDCHGGNPSGEKAFEAHAKDRGFVGAAGAIKNCAICQGNSPRAMACI